MNEFRDECCVSQRPVQIDRINTTGSSEIPVQDISIVQKRDADRYLGTSLFIFATIGSTIASIIITTIVIFLIIKRQIQHDKKPQQPVRLLEKVASRTSFYF